MRNSKILVLFLSTFLFLGCKSSSENVDKNQSFISTENGFAISNNGQSTSIYLSDNEFVGVKKIAQKFQEDVERVTSIKPSIITGESPSEGTAIIVGTIGNSELIDKLIADKKLDVSSIEGKWETFLIQTIENPLDGVDEALVIIGSDKRGTIYGMFDVSYEMGVSPLYFWADVPVKKKENVFIARGTHTKGTPKVKYRGIFINDEAPSLTNWVYPKFGGFNAKFYDHVFELILRMKGNYIWPAMWQPRMFYEDDPQNSILANEYGVVIGTSHHEPLTRAHAEWRRFGEGEWNYNSNPENLKKFWTEAMERLGDKEALVTVGMRGDGDEALSEETATEMLEKVVADQRKIIENVTGKPASETPQMWALYKEVMDYYDKGMRVPDDVTLLLCDDNWGNIRKLPALDAKPRSGGYGIYYHFDYVGGPRNYKWINTTQIERVWEQMHLAYEHDVKDIWVVNVGDIKPMEFPIEFFLDYAWNPDNWTADNLQDYYTEWSTKQFGDEYAEEIADLVRTYTKYNARRKHELLNIPKYSLTHYNEADNMLADFKVLEEKTLALKAKLPQEYLDAYYHLVEHPVVASANLNELYIAAFKNKMYAEQGNVVANEYAKKVKDLYLKDSLITKYYHEELADGKWNGIMSQMHIGYTSWQHSRYNNIPETVLVDVNDEPHINGIFVQDFKKYKGDLDNDEYSFSEYDNLNSQKYSFEIFGRYSNELNSWYEVIPKDDWIIIEHDSINSSEQSHRKIVSIDWDKLSFGTHQSNIQIINKVGFDYRIIAHKFDETAKGFIESNNYISFEADNFSSKTEPSPFTWEVIENLGKTGSSIMSSPIKESRVELTENSPKLSYNVHFQNKGKVKVHAYFSPTLKYSTKEGMYFGLSFDDEKPTQVNYDSDSYIFNYNGKVPSQWGKNVAESIKIITTEFEISEAGNHILNYFRVDEGLVLQKIVIETGENGLPQSYLGSPESAVAE